MKILKTIICTFILTFLAAVPGRASSILGHLPMEFEPNMGQSESSAAFLSRGNGYALFLSSSEAVWLLDGSHSDKKDSGIERVRMQVLGSKPDSRSKALDPLESESHYFLGNESRRWNKHVPHFGRIQFQEAYPGIDLAYYGNQSQLEYDFLVNPGADPSLIKLGFKGADSVSIQSDGSLLVKARSGNLTFKAPLCYQQTAHRRSKVQGHYVLNHGKEVSFKLGVYDRTRMLVIDPVLIFSTYFGGNNADFLDSVVLDSSGNIYVSGLALSTNMPVASAYQPAKAANYDAFVAKLNPTASALIFSTYLGGSSEDLGIMVRLDSSNNVILAGSTRSNNFPTQSPLQASNNAFGVGGSNNFITKFDPTGASLIYSTYLGGNWNNPCTGLAVDLADNVYVTGHTDATNFPTTGGAYQTVAPGSSNAYVSKISPAGALVYSTYLGGSSTDDGEAIAVDPAGNAYVFGVTTSSNFPTVGAIQAANGGGNDLFLTKLNAAGTGLVYSTYLGGSGNEGGRRIHVDAAGQAFLAGDTTSTNFPTAAPLQAANAGGIDAVAAEVNAAGSALVFSTYLGGTASDSAACVVTDPGGNVYLTGYTTSTNFPTLNPIQASAGGSNDIFVTELNPAGSALLFSTYFGGSLNENGNALAVDPTGMLITVVGSVVSSNFPVQSAYQSTLAGLPYDGFITQFSLATSTPTSTFSASPTFSPTLTATRTATPTFTVTGTPTYTSTASPTLTASPTPSSTPTASPSATPTFTPTASPTATLTASPSPSATPTASLTFTVSPTYTETPYVPLPVNGGTYIYPSPVKGPLANVVIVMEEPGTVKVTIYNERADLVQSVGQSAAAGLAQVPIDVRPYASGVYLYRVVLDYASGKSRTVSFKKFAVIHE